MPNVSGKHGIWGQMELYLRYLAKNENETAEKMPIGLILCAESNKEQIEFLQLDQSGIKLAEYLTELQSISLSVCRMAKVLGVDCIYTFLSLDPKQWSGAIPVTETT